MLQRLRDFLKPKESERFHLLEQPKSALQIEIAVSVDQDFAIAHRLADRPDAVDTLPRVRRDFRSAAPERHTVKRSQLDSVETELDGPAGHRRETGCVTRIGGTINVRVVANRLPQLAAEKLITRHARDLALNVEQSLFDPAESAAGRAAELRDLRLNLSPQPFDVMDAAPLNKLKKILQFGNLGIAFAGVGCVPDATDPGAGLDSRNHPVAPLVYPHPKDFQARDNDIRRGLIRSRRGLTRRRRE